MSVEISVEDNKFIINNYSTTDEEIVSYFGEVPSENISDRFSTCLRVGVVALKSISIGDRLDYVEKEFNKLGQKFDESLGEIMTSIEAQLNEILGEDGTFSRTMDEYLGEDGTLSEIIDENFGEGGILVRDIFDPTKDGTPLYRLRNLLIDEIQRLRKDLGIAEAVKEVVEETPKKGFEFEDRCEEYLNDIVKSRFGDELERTTTSPGIVKDSLKGDFVITLSERPDCRIVLETKDVGEISLPEIRRSLEASMENRDARYGIFVSKWLEGMPKFVGCFNEYSGKYLVCALTTREHEGIIHPEILNIAVCWARNRVLLEAVEAEGIDVSALQARLGEIEGKLAIFTRIRTECTNVENAVNRIRDHCRQIQDEIDTELRAIREDIERTLSEEV